MKRETRTAYLMVLGAAVVLAAGPGVRAAEPGLVAHWTLDEGVGDLAGDASGHNHDGDITGGQWVRGAFGTALRFTGENSYVTVDELAGVDGGDALTVEAWVYWEGAGRYPNIITGGHWCPGGFLMFVVDNVCQFRMGRPGGKDWDRKQWREVSSLLVNRFKQGRWYHLAATFQRPHITTYVDGKPVGKARWDFPVACQGQVRIGSWSGKACHKGLIDEVKVYNRALSAQEIAAAYAKEAPKRAPVAGKPAYQMAPRTATVAQPVAVLENEWLKLGVDRRARAVTLLDKTSGVDRLAVTRPLVWLRKAGRTHRRATCEYEGGQLRVRFGKADVTVTIGVKDKGRYFTFEVLDVKGAGVEQLTFLDLRLAPAELVNRTSGAILYKDFGVCMRTLNLPTRVAIAWNQPFATATCYEKYGLVGAKAALVACPRRTLRDVLKDVMRNEGVLHSPLGGPFSLDAEENRGMYLFARVSESNVDEWIDLARRGGFTHIHFGHPGRTLGHYEPNPSLFPNGYRGVKAVCDKIHAAGLKVGMHILTGMISPGDPWVTPVPDKRLSVDASYTLAVPLGVKDTTVRTAEAPGKHDVVWAYSSRGNVVRIGGELIMYSGISRTAPYGFTGCRRGVFGTKPSAHKQGESVGHLRSLYASFLPDEQSTLVGEIGDAVARMFNTGKMDMIYMDGSEAMGTWYGVARIRHEIFKRLKSERILVEASAWGHHSWPFHSRIGAWDHPKWGPKRFHDAHCRQLVSMRTSSLLGFQLGWWAIVGPGRDWRMQMPDEVEYLCLKAMAHDGPLSFQGVRIGHSPWNARQDECFTMIGQYERLRLARYFSEDVLARIGKEREEFKLEQAPEGEWRFRPVDYLKHKVTSLANGTNTWTVQNRFGAQPLKLRIEALYSAAPYDSADALALADFAKPKPYRRGPAAPGVSHTFDTTAKSIDGREARACFQARNTKDTRENTWARVERAFEPHVDLRRHDAMGVWVHGDGKGELLNLQLRSPRQYHVNYGDHYVDVDFRGWRYFELFIRERDAARHGDYKWPYRGHSAIYRSPLTRAHLSELNLYLNHLPPKGKVCVRLGPVKALRSERVELRNPTIEAGGRKLTFPVALKSGYYIEFDSIDDCRLYDERGVLLERVRPQGRAPELAAGANTLTFTCRGPKGVNARAEVVAVASGEAFGGRRDDDRIDWARLGAEYEPPRTVLTVDGRDNRWSVSSRTDKPQARVGMELTVHAVGSPGQSYDSPDALELDGFEDASRFEESKRNQFAKFVYDSQHKGISCKPGVTQKLSLSAKLVKSGRTSGLYTATSKRQDNAGWSCKGKRLPKPIDLSGYKGIGFWLAGDGKGESFKLQLRDVKGGWRDMVTRVDFTGWRYCEFDLAGPNLDATQVEYVLIYFNGVPGGQTVTCHVDGIRALREPTPLRRPTLSVAGRSIAFPVSLATGDRLVFRGMDNCKLHRKGGAPVAVRPEGRAPMLRPGPNPVELTLAPGAPERFRVSVSLVKEYQP